MSSVLSAIQNTVPITLFNKGLAGKIFSEVRKSGAKVVMKNNKPECVILSPEEYTYMIDEINDMRLFKTAIERLEGLNPENAAGFEDVLGELGITESDLEEYEEVEIE